MARPGRYRRSGADHISGSATGERGFIGDYVVFASSTNYATFVSTYDEGTNPNHRQQQVVAAFLTRS